MHVCVSVHVCVRTCVCRQQRSLREALSCHRAARRQHVAGTWLHGQARSWTSPGRGGGAQALEQQHVPALGMSLGVARGARPAPASRGGGWRRLGVRRRPPSRDGELGGLARTSFGVLQGLHMTESENVQDGDRNFPPLPAAPLAGPSGPGGSVRGALDGRHSGHDPRRTHDMLHALRCTQTQTADPRTRRQEERPQATARGRPLRRAGAPPRDLAQEGSLVK